MINDITDFLPKYPNIHNTDINFLNSYEEDFYKSTSVINSIIIIYLLKSF